MTINIDIKPQLKEAQLGDYGVFHIRPLGVNEDMRLSALAEEHEKTFEEIKALQEQFEQKKIKNDDEKALARIDELERQMKKRSAELAEIWRGVISSDDPKAVDRLFKELQLPDIIGAIREVLENA